MARHPDGTEEDLPTREMLLLAADDGTVPITLNEWERKVLDSEAAQPGYQGWYRNPDRATKQSLAVAYKDEDRKSTRLNSSHVSISYAFFCLKNTQRKN